jgi:hypothetical protein
MPLPLPDDLHFAIQRAAAPIVPAERNRFVQEVVNELAKAEVLGEGNVHRAVAALQSRYTVEARGEANTASAPRHFASRRPTHRGARRLRP